jgi:osmotically-inducible protein OsmY
MNKTDNQLKEDIEQELRWDPKVNAAQIGVSVDKGVVSLLGAVDTFPEKWAAEDATKRVCGVRTVAQDLTVKLLLDHVRTDSDIATATQNALKWDVYVPNAVTAKVHQGAITLEGQVTWNYQREAAARAVRYLAGVVSVFNAITLKPQTSSSEVKDKVSAALQRHASADAKSIHVNASGGKVTLTGHPSSWQAVEDAVDAAWSAPGVTEVDDQLQIQ